jgi:hypothetical protein
MSNVIQPVSQILDACAQNIKQQLSSASQAFLEIGCSLHEAKEALNNHDDFALWWKNNTTLGSQRTVSAYIQVAQRFAGKSIASKVSYSVLQELVSADDEVVDGAEKRAEERPLTVKEARAMVRPPITINNNMSPKENISEAGAGAEAPSYANGYVTGEAGEAGEAGERRSLTPEEKIDAKFASLEPEPEPEPEPVVAQQGLTYLEREAEILGLPEEDRIKNARSGLVILGFSDVGENLPAESTAIRILTALEQEYPHLSGQLARAREEISDLY